MLASAYETAAPRIANSAARWVVSPPARSAPIIVATPIRPNRAPASRRGFSFSFSVRKCAATTVKIGVEAFRIEARPLASRGLTRDDQDEGNRVVEEAHQRQRREVVEHSFGREAQ